MKKAAWFLAALLALPAWAQQSLAELTPQARRLRQAEDLRAVARYRNGLEEAVRYARAHPQIFARDEAAGGANGAAAPRLLAAAEREAVRHMWQRVLDYYLALDSARRFHGDYAALQDREERRASFRVARAAFLASYSNALNLLDAMGRTDLDPLLNEAVPELGLPASTYDRFRFRFLNVAMASEFAALESTRTLHVLRGAIGRNADAEVVAAEAAAARDAAAILDAGKGRGHVMTAANGVNVARKALHAAWFPAQAGVAEWMGDVKVYRPQRSLISAQQVAALAPQLEPGDIILTRREWYLSNIGLPGFWPHAAIYIGTAEERARYFADAEVQAWVRAQGEPSGSLERLLATRYPQAHAAGAAPQEQGRLPRVLEAISEGVTFTTLEHAADADSLAVLRPRRGKAEKAQALLRAWGYAGRPYDFDFDFRTDAALVCTELVFKAYEPAPGMRGLELPLLDVMGRRATPANEIVKQFDAQYGTPAQQSELVAFLDGDERRRGAMAAGLETFRASWQRPKWHVLAPQASAQLPPAATAAHAAR